MVFVNQSAVQIRGVTNATTKFYYVVSTIPQSVAGCVVDLVQGASGDDSYNILKAWLCDIFKPSDYARYDRLLKLGDLGQARPTALLDSMCAICTNKPTTEGPLFRHLFLARLPQDIRTHLLSFKTESVRNLAIRANTLCAARLEHPVIAAVAPEPPVEVINCTLPSVEPVISAAGRSRPRAGQRRPAAASNATADEGYCWYHNKH